MEEESIYIYNTSQDDLDKRIEDSPKARRLEMVNVEVEGAGLGAVG